MEERSCLGPCWSRCRVLGGGGKRTPPGQGSWEGLVQSPHTATCRASGEAGAQKTQEAVCARRGAGEVGGQSCDQRKPRVSGAAPGRSCRQTREPAGAGAAARQGAREPGRALCWERSGLLETRRIRFQINEIWVHTFTLLLPALMLF